MSKNQLDPKNDLGLYLKSSREALSISIEQVCQETKIQKSYIESLETNNYKNLPERTYALGYLRSYANYLNLENVNDLINILDNQYDFVVPKYSSVPTPLDEKKNIVSQEVLDINLSSNVEDFKITETNNINIVKKSNKSNISSALKVNQFKYNTMVIGFSVALIFIVLFVLYGFLYNKKNKDDQLNQSKNDLEEILSDTSISNLINNGVVYNDSASTKNNTQPQINSNLGNNNSVIAEKQENIDSKDSSIETFNFIPFPLTNKTSFINLIFVESVWVRIYRNSNANDIYLDRIFLAGEQYNIPAVDGIAITIGNVKGVEFYVESKKLNLSKNTNNVIRGLTLDKESLLQKYYKE